MQSLTPEAWSASWLDEWREEISGPASAFIQDLIQTAPGDALSVLVVLAEAASAGADPEELSWVGAGPLEDLIRGMQPVDGLLDDIERRAAESPAFRAAIGFVWLGHDLDPVVRQRLNRLGARSPG